MNQELAALASVLLAGNAAWRGAAIENTEHITGDASGRRYTRLFLRGAPAPTAVLMQLSDRRGPPAAGEDGLTQNDALVELSGCLRYHEIGVPEVLADRRDLAALLVEDVGEAALWRFALDQPAAGMDRVRAGIPGDAVLTLYCRAADVIVELQRILPSAGCRPLRRSFEFEQYRAEAHRFLDHFADPRSLLQAERPAVQEALDQLCRAVAGHPRRLVHRDYMPWNLFVSPSGAIRVLDFQDALMGSYAYDLASLIHDRDADFALGPERCRAVFQHFKDRLGLGMEFKRHYLEAVLQRHFRLAGQFCLLTQKTGNAAYQNWVPGCLKRIGRALATLPGQKAFLDLLASAIPEIKEGAEHPLNLKPV